MPKIDVAMARSLHGGIWERLRHGISRSIAANLDQRDIITDAADSVSDAATAFSSWDNCMAADYCKYPVIAIIIVGSLIILGIVTCIVRCACCAKSCCCSCFKCFKCCGNCCGCCDPPGSKKHKYLDEPYIPPNQGYRTEAPMNPTFPSAMAAPATTGVTVPQYAEFETSKKQGEDSLPQMPSWDGASSKKVELEQEAVELTDLEKTPTEKTDLRDPLMNGAPRGPASPLPRENSQNPYGRSTPNHAGEMGAQQPPRGPYASENPYDLQSDGYGLDQPYDVPPAAAGAVHGGRNSPGPGMYGYGSNHLNQGYGDMPPAGMGAAPGGRNSPAPSLNGYGINRMDTGYSDIPSASNEYRNEYGNTDPYSQTPASGPQPVGAPPGYGMRRQGTGEDSHGHRVGSPGPGYKGYGMRQGMERAGSGSPGPYGMDPRMRTSPGPRSSPRPTADPYARPPRHSPAPPGGRGGYGPPGSSPSRENFSNQSYSPAPDRQYVQSPRPINTAGPSSPLSHQHDPPSSPIVNNSGFDFTSGFSRPATSGYDHYDRRPSESHEGAGQEGYPGYKPYRPVHEGWSGV